jgi:hypothetical protein
LVVLTMQTHMKEHNVQTWASGALRKLAIDRTRTQASVSPPQKTANLVLPVFQPSIGSGLSTSVA